MNSHYGDIQGVVTETRSWLCDQLSDSDILCTLVNSGISQSLGSSFQSACTSIQFTTSHLTYCLAKHFLQSHFDHHLIWVNG